MYRVLFLVIHLAITNAQWSKLCNPNLRSCNINSDSNPDLPTLLSKIDIDYTIRITNSITIKDPISIHAKGLTINGGTIIQSNINCLFFNIFAANVNFQGVTFQCANSPNYFVVYHAAGKVYLQGLTFNGVVLPSYILFGNPNSPLQLTTDNSKITVLVMQAGGTCTGNGCNNLQSLGLPTDSSLYYQGLNIDFSCSPTSYIQKSPCASMTESLIVLFGILIGGISIGLFVLGLSYYRKFENSIHTNVMTSVTQGLTGSKINDSSL